LATIRQRYRQTDRTDNGPVAQGQGEPFYKWSPQNGAPFSATTRLLYTAVYTCTMYTFTCVHMRIFWFNYLS